MNMTDKSKTKEQLIDELTFLRQQISTLEESITECKRVELHIAETLQFNQTILAASPAGILTYNSSGQCISANEAASKIVGGTIEQLLTQSFRYLKSWEKSGMLEAAENALTKGQDQVLETHLVTTFDKDRWFSCRFTPFHHEGVLHLLLLISDITDHKKAEEALRESEQRYRILTENASDIIWTLDLNLRFTYASPSVEKLQGWTMEELKSLCLQDIMTPESLDRVMKAFEEALTLEKITGINPKKSRTIELEEYRKDGSIIWLEVTASFLRDKEGNPIGIMGISRDITDRKKSEDILRQSENWYRTIFENTGTATVILEEDTTIVLANTEFEKLSGCTKKEIEGNTSWTEFVLKEDLGWMAEKHRQRRIDNEAAPTHYEFRFRDKSANVRNVFLKVDMVPGTNRSVASLLDITERKRAEEALRESEEKYRLVVENASEAIFIAQGGILKFVNQAMIRLLGYSEEEITSLPFTHFIHPEDRGMVLDRHFKRIAGEAIPPVYSFRVVTKSGDILWTEIHAVVIWWKEKPATLNFLSDITERRRVDEVLRHSEERFSKAFHISPAPTIISTINEGRYIDVNDEFLRMLGYSREDIIGRTASELNVWANYKDREAVTRKLTEKGYLQGEMLHLRTKRGEIRNVLVSAEVITINEENFILSIFYDITDQKRLEAQLHQAQKMEAIGTLAGGIAHDFNNILSAIMGYTDMALANPKLDDRLRRYLNQVYKAGERATGLVKQILAFSRQSDQKPRPLRISPIIKEVLKLLRASLPTTITIQQAIQSEMDTVLADPTQIHQILMNLCTNAAHAMRETKGALKVSLVPVEVNPDDTLIIHHDLSPGMYLKLTVCDAGGGIASEIMDRIFDPFFTTKKSSEGTGLGLSVVHGIVKSYHGAITVESEVGKGTEFHVYLPLLKETEEKREVEAAARITGGKERILFVDDEEGLVQLGKDMLTSLGYKVIERTSSLEALKLFQSSPDRFDLVITDMTMPNMTGIELAQELMRIRPGIPIILCTGFSEEITPEKAEALGLREFIMKPIINNQIAEIIRRVLDQKEQRPPKAL